jgi:hypothetical protein
MATNIIFVLSEARTGSTMLCQLLTRFQPTINFMEVFNLNKEDLYKNDPKFNELLDSHYAESFEFIKDPMKLLSLMTTYFKKTLIIKIHLFQLQLFSEENINLILSSPNHKFILLTRSNFLEKYVSLKIAKKTDIWVNKDTSKFSIEIDKDDLTRTFVDHQIIYESIKKRLENHNIDYLPIDYDLYLKNYDDQKFIELLTPWIVNQGLDLHLSDVRPRTPRKQNNSTNIADNILNYDELANFINTELLK